MAASNDSFFLDAFSHEAYQHEIDDHETVTESRDEALNDLHATSADTQPSCASARDMSTADTPLLKDASPQATFIFVIGDHRFSDSCELGILNEHPEALKAITSNPCLSTSAFLKPALQAAMAELQPSLMVPAAVRLTAISLRLVAGILPNHQSSHQGEGVDQGEEQKLSKMVQHEARSGCTLLSLARIEALLRSSAVSHGATGRSGPSHGSIEEFVDRSFDTGCCGR